MIRVSGMEIEQGFFPDHTLLMKLDINDLDPNYRLLVEWYYENDSELFTLICVKRHLDQVYPLGDARLYMPYIPHARMDRVKGSADVFTLKYFCEVINSLKFSEVIVRDAHSNVSVALLDRVSQEDISDYIQEAIEESEADVLFYPDEGAMKRYSGHSKLPFAFGMKDREWETGKIKGLTLFNAEAVKDKNVLIVDDICSRGGTFIHSAKALKAAGAKSVSLYVTHCEHTMLEGEIPKQDLIDHVYTTKSLWFENNHPHLVTIVG